MSELENKNKPTEQYEEEVVLVRCARWFACSPYSIPNMKQVRQQLKLDYFESGVFRATKKNLSRLKGYKVINLGAHDFYQLVHGYYSHAQLMKRQEEVEKKRIFKNIARGLR